jgi:hypothetical protein
METTRYKEIGDRNFSPENIKIHFLLHSRRHTDSPLQRPDFISICEKKVSEVKRD